MSSPASSSRSTYQVGVNDWAVFSSPSGKNSCSYQQETMACVVSEAALKDTGGKHLVALNSSGVSFLDIDLPIAESLGEGGSWATSGPGPVPPADTATHTVYTLPYGSSLTAGSITCTSSTNGFSCSNSAGGFTVNSERVTTR